MAESPEDLIKEAAFAAALGMGLTIATPVSGFVGIAGVLFSIQAFYQSYEELKNLDDNCARLREVARMVTIAVVESIAEGAIRKAGSTVKEAAAGVALLVKDTKVWQSTCDWLKKHISDIADLAGSAVKSTVDGVLAKLRGGMNTLLYQYINRKADDIYTELKDLVDEDAIDYLKKSFNQHRNLKLLTTVSEWASSAQEIKGGKLKEYELIYIDNAVANGTARETVFKTIKGYISSKLTIPTLPKGGLPKGEYAIEKKNDDIKLQNETARILAAAGYDIRMLPELPGGNGYGRTEKANPDYLIMNDRVFDCYSPDNGKKPNKI